MAKLAECLLAEPTDHGMQRAVQLLFAAAGGLATTLLAARWLAHRAYSLWGPAAASNGWPILLSLCVAGVGALIGLAVARPVARRSSRTLRLGIFRCGQVLTLVILGVFFSWSVYGLISGALPAWFGVTSGALWAVLALSVFKPVNSKLRTLLSTKLSR